MGKPHQRFHETGANIVELVRERIGVRFLVHHVVTVFHRYLGIDWKHDHVTRSSQQTHVERDACQSMIL